LIQILPCLPEPKYPTKDFRRQADASIEYLDESSLAEPNSLVMGDYLLMPRTALKPALKT
jgi:hypothetical protein